MKRKTGLFQRMISVIFSFILSSSIVLTSVPVNAWAAEDFISDTVKENTPHEIVSFAELPEEVSQQDVTIGTSLDELMLPDTLTVFFRMDDEDLGDTEEETEAPEDSLDDNTENTEDSEDSSDKNTENSDDVAGDNNNSAENPDDLAGDNSDSGEGSDETFDGSGDNLESPDGDKNDNFENTDDNSDDITEKSEDETNDNVENANDSSDDIIVDESDEENASSEPEVVQETIVVQADTNYAAPDRATLQISSLLDRYAAEDDIVIDEDLVEVEDESAVIDENTTESEGETIADENTVVEEDDTIIDEGSTEEEDENDTVTDGNTAEEGLTAVVIEGITWISTPEYDGKKGTYVFTPVLPEGYLLAESAVLPEITVTVSDLLMFAAVVPLDESSNHIDSDITWYVRHSLVNCTITIDPGVTLTITQPIEIDGTVTIQGGGTVKRGTDTAYFLADTASDSLTLQNITMDGNFMASNQPMVRVSGAKAILNNGCKIINCNISRGDTQKGSAVQVVWNGTLEINGAAFNNCVASDRGGAIYLENNSKATINGANFSSCHANYGGAVSCVNSTVSLENTTIENCYATYSGGAICNERTGAGSNSTVTISSGTYRSNYTTSNTPDNYGIMGGGFIANSGTLTISGGSFEGNNTPGMGGCIYNDASSGTSATLSGGIFTGNTASSDNGRAGGAIYDSATNARDAAGATSLILSGNVIFDGASNADGIYLDRGNGFERKIDVTSGLTNPLTIYLAAEDPGDVDRYVIATGSGYELKNSDLYLINIVSTNDNGPWYVKLEGNNAILTKDVPEEKFFLYYNSNGATGQVLDNNNNGEGYDKGTTVQVQSAASLTWSGHTFLYWYTDPNPANPGTRYNPGDRLTMTGNITLYAIFRDDNPGTGDSGNNGGNTEDPGNSGDSGNGGNSGNNSGSGDSGNWNGQENSGNDGTASESPLISINAQTDSSRPGSNNHNGQSPITGIPDSMQLYVTLAMIAGLSALMLLFIGRHGMTEEEKNARLARLVRWARRGGKLRKILSLAAIFLLLACYHSVGKQTLVEAAC